MSVSTFLITGGAGFIGSHLSLRLAGDGHYVKILDNFSSRPREEFEQLAGSHLSRIEVIDGDIRDRSVCRNAVAGAEFVLHHAAMASVPASIAHPDYCLGVNVLGTVNLLEEAYLTGQCKRFVLASSSSVYGDLMPVTKVETAPLDPLSPYATSKLTGEMLCRNYTNIRGLPTVALRYFNVFGPRQDPNGPYAAVIPKFIQAIAEGDRPVIYGDGEHSRDFVSVQDVVQANVLACVTQEKDVVGRAFNIGSGRRTTLNGLIGVFAEITGKSVHADYRPPRSADILHSLADVSSARERLNFSPKLSLEDGLRQLMIAVD